MKKNRVPERERLFFPTEWKAIEGENNIIEGYAAVFGNIDLGDDIVEAGAFTKTINERIPKGLVKLFDSHIWDSAHTLGTVIEATEDQHGLRIKAKISDTPSAQEVKKKILEGHINRMSIGYDSVIESWEKIGEKMIRRLKEIKLFEASVVPIAMNEGAMILSAKAITPFQDLPINDNPVNITEAFARVKSWANGNWSKYRKAFLWVNHLDPTDEKNYKMQIADVINNDLEVIKEAIVTCAKSIMLGTSGLPDEVIPQVKAHLEKYYAQMELIAPWNMDMKDFIIEQYKLLPEVEQKEIVTAMAKSAEPPHDALTDKTARYKSKARALELSLQI